LLILAVPLFDTAYVMTLRAASGRNPFLGSPDHLAVRLRCAGWPAGRIAMAACAATLVSSTAGILLLFLPPALAPWPPALVLAGLLAAGVVLARVDVSRPAPPPIPRIHDGGAPAPVAPGPDVRP
jgi:UDP-GlcNAc:undecaprenyl-phosphate GlcNAc-1-phosphate transferase